jgi:hypothetical protein
MLEGCSAGMWVRMRVTRTSMSSLLVRILRDGMILRSRVLHRSVCHKQDRNLVTNPSCWRENGYAVEVVGLLWAAWTSRMVDEEWLTAVRTSRVWKTDGEDSDVTTSCYGIMLSEPGG